MRQSQIELPQRAHVPQRSSPDWTNAERNTILRKALNLIPHRLLTLSFVGIPIVVVEPERRTLHRGNGRRASVRIASDPVAGHDLPIYYNLPESVRVHFDRLNIPLPNHRAVYAEPALARISNSVITEEGLTLNDFKARILKKAFAAKSSRPGRPSGRDSAG